MRKISEHIKASYLVFAEEKQLISAIQEIQKAEIKIWDVITPHPIDLNIPSLNKKNTAGRITFIIGMIAFIVSLLFQGYIHYEMDLYFGMRTMTPWVNFILVAVSLSLLFASLTLLLWFMIRSNLHPGQQNQIFTEILRPDEYCVVIEEREAEYLITLLPYLTKEVKNPYIRQTIALPFPVKHKSKYHVSLIIYIPLLFTFFAGCTDINGRQEKETSVVISKKSNAVGYMTDKEYYPYTNDKEGYLNAGEELSNPLMKSKSNLALGKELYLMYCKHCHGLKGDSDAPMIREKKYPPPPWFRSRIPTISEGNIYHSLHYGKNLMPGNENDLTTEEKWLLVMFVETFAKKTN